MFPLLIKSLPSLLTITTSFGVLLHDTQIDHATSTALLPAAFATYAAADTVIKFNDNHLHTDRTSIGENITQLRSGQPRTPARSDEDKKYIVAKKLAADSGGSEYHWPSI